MNKKKFVFPKDPFTESEIGSFITEVAPDIQFNHHYFASEQRYAIDTAIKIGEILKHVYDECGPEVTRFIVKISGLSNYVSYRE